MVIWHISGKEINNIDSDIYCHLNLANAEVVISILVLGQAGSTLQHGAQSPQVGRESPLFTHVPQLQGSSWAELALLWQPCATTGLSFRSNAENTRIHFFSSSPPCSPFYSLLSARKERVLKKKKLCNLPKPMTWWPCFVSALPYTILNMAQHFLEC